MCVFGCSPEFRFNNHLERAVPLDDDQPKKMLLKRDADSSEVRDEHKCSTEHPSECSVQGCNEAGQEVDTLIGSSLIAWLKIVCLQCFDAVGWAAGRASGQ